MRNIIAVVKLAPGQAGYYDAVSGIYLTVASPIANVYQGMNTTRLQYALREKRIVLVSGSLTPIRPYSQEMDCKTLKKAVEIVEPVAVAVQAETAQVEEIKPAKKKTTTKKTTETAKAVEAAEAKEGSEK